MEPAESLREHIRELEERLLRPEVRRSRENLDELLADEFTEFASDGAAYAKAQVIDALQSELPYQRSLLDFRLVALAEDVMLSTYRSTRRGDAPRESVESLRSSIWKRRNGRWQMIFHQGSRSVAPQPGRDRTQRKPALLDAPHATATTILNNRIHAQLALVKEHVRRENAHDLPGIMATFGHRAWYDDEPWGEHHEGRDAVHSYYEGLLTSLPDLHIDVVHSLAGEEGIALEVRISGTHLGSWRGLPATGRPVAFPLCGLYAFDEEGKIAGERIYYDRGSVLHQVGLYHDPQTLLGRIETLLAHPVTVARACARKVFRTGA